MASSNGKHYMSKDSKTPSAKTQLLRPASPPKVNPWTKKRPATSLAPDWPSITPDFENINETAETNKTKEAKGEKQNRLDTKSSCPADSKNDDELSPSRKIFQAAAPRAGDSLWLRPFGADVFVCACLDSKECQSLHNRFAIHRRIVEPQSGWFREYFRHVDPENPDIDVHLVHLPFCHQGVAFTLRFMYTHTIEILDGDRKSMLDLALHIACGALLYIGAIDLKVDAMKDHIIRVLQQTAQDLTCHLVKTFSSQTMDHQDVVVTVSHLRNALELAYENKYYGETLFLRLSLAKLLDALLPCLIRHAVFVDLLSTDIWKRRSAAISADLFAARQAREGTGETDVAAQKDPNQR